MMDQQQEVQRGNFDDEAETVALHPNELESLIVQEQVAQSRYNTLQGVHLEATTAKNKAEREWRTLRENLAGAVSVMQQTATGARVVRVGAYALCFDGPNYWFVAPWPEAKE